jgi:Cu+-exporting ATPase
MRARPPALAAPGRENEGERMRGDVRPAGASRWEVVMAMVTDPVCGMRIDPDDAVATVEHEGKTYYFCSEVCRDAFVADPASFTA